MVNKKTNNPKVTIPKEVTTIPDLEDNSIPTTNKLSTTTTGLITIKQTRNKTPRQVAVQQQSNNNNKVLGISQRRQLASNTARKVTKIEPIINKILKLLLDQNVITTKNVLKSYNVLVTLDNPTRYNINLLINYKDTEIDIMNITKQLNTLKLFAVIEVLPPQAQELIIVLGGYKEPKQVKS